MKLKYAIVGSGAMGSVLAGALAKGGVEVWCFDPYEAHMKAIEERGLTLTINGQDELVTGIRATTNASDVGEVDVVIVMVKGPITRATMPNIHKMRNPETYVLTLQNGYGHIDIIEEEGVPKDRILHGVIGFGARLIEPGHTGASINPGRSIDFGPVNHIMNPLIERIAEDFNKGGLLAHAMVRPEKKIWFKLAMNCSANAQCGLAACNMGHWHKHFLAKDLTRKVQKEIVMVANAKGIPLMMEELLAVENREMGPMALHFPSTAQDMRDERPTEIDFLNGAIYREGQKHGIETPYNETIYKLTKIYEDAYDIEF